jgi:hypothetical protein
MFVKVVEMAVSTVLIVVFTVLIAVETVDLIPFHTPVKNETMPFQTLEKKVFTVVQTVSQSVPNQPRNTSAIPLSVSSTVEGKVFMK